jgi:hypothetical protein
MNKTTELHPITRKVNCGPVLLKMDAGPERIVLSGRILAQREALIKQGLVMITGLPNATSIQQKWTLPRDISSLPCTQARGENVVQAKLKQPGIAKKNHGKRLQCAVLSLDFSNLPSIVNGT